MNDDRACTPMFRDHLEAFENAIKRGIFSRFERNYDYAGNWMYMHTNADGSDSFKNIDTRKYISVPNEVLQSDK